MPVALVAVGAGFMGAYALQELLAMGHDVVAPGDLSSGFARRIDPCAAFVQGSITDHDPPFRRASLRPCAPLAALEQESMGLRVEVRRLETRKVLFAFIDESKGEGILGERRATTLAEGLARMAPQAPATGACASGRFSTIGVEQGLPPGWREGQGPPSARLSSAAHALRALHRQSPARPKPQPALPLRAVRALLGEARRNGPLCLDHR